MNNPLPFSIEDEKKVLGAVLKNIDFLRGLSTEQMDDLSFYRMDYKLAFDVVCAHVDEFGESAYEADIVDCICKMTAEHEHAPSLMEMRELCRDAPDNYQEVMRSAAIINAMGMRRKIVENCSRLMVAAYSFDKNDYSRELNYVEALKVCFHYLEAISCSPTHLN